MEMFPGVRLTFQKLASDLVGVCEKYFESQGYRRAHKKSIYFLACFVCVLTMGSECGWGLGEGPNLVEGLKIEQFDANIRVDLMLPIYPSTWFGDHCVQKHPTFTSLCTRDMHL